MCSPSSSDWRSHTATSGPRCLAQMGKVALRCGAFYTRLACDTAVLMFNMATLDHFAPVWNTFHKKRLHLESSAKHHNTSHDITKNVFFSLTGGATWGWVRRRFRRRWGPCSLVADARLPQSSQLESETPVLLRVRCHKQDTFVRCFVIQKQNETHDLHAPDITTQRHIAIVFNFQPG